VTLMNATTPGKLPDDDICMLAQLVLDAAGEDASLITRSHSGGGDAAVHWHAIPSSGEERHLPLPLPLALESRVDLAARQQLEELVSIAVASAQQADEALQRAHQFSTRAKRWICGAICIGAPLFLVAIAGITDHLPYYKSDREFAAKAGDGLAVAEPQRHVSGQLNGLEDQTLASAPIGPLRRLSSTAPILDPAVEEASAANSNVVGRSTVQPDERSDTTATPAASQAPRERNAPTGATAQAYPTQPYGINTSTSVKPPGFRANLWPSSEHRPSRVLPTPKHTSSAPRPVASTADSGPSGDPVRDFQRFTTAVGRGIGSLFR
jgi:hypothetical protein